MIEHALYSRDIESRNVFRAATRRAACLAKAFEFLTRPAFLFAVWNAAPGAQLSRCPNNFVSAQVPVIKASRLVERQNMRFREGFRG